MKDSAILNNGKSKILKAPSDMPTSFETWRDQLLAGTAKMDIVSNSEGIEVVGTPLNKATLLTDATALAIGLSQTDPTVNDALNALCDRILNHLQTVDHGGTGAITASSALSNLGGLPRLGGFDAGEVASNTNFRFNSSNGSDGIIRVNSGSGESGIGFQTAGNKFWTIGKGCGGSDTAFALWCNQSGHTGNKLVIKPTGEVSVVNHIQFGDVNTQNVYAKFVDEASGNYYGLHAVNGGFYLHEQNAADGVLGTYLGIDTDHKMSLGSNGVWVRNDSSHGIAMYGNGIYPTDGSGNYSDGVMFLGGSSGRFYAVYSQNGVITTSDKRKKTDIDYNVDKYSAFFSALKPARYKYIDDSDDVPRYRLGFIAQDVEDALGTSGLTLGDFVGLRKETIKEGSDEAIPDNIMYELNYQEFIALTVAMVQDQKAEINRLSARLKTLEEAQ